MTRGAVDKKIAAEGRCRLCQRPSAIRPLTRHRIVPGRFGGTYSAANCVGLCDPCHSLVDGHSHRVPAHAPDRRDGRRMLRASLWPEELAHARNRWPRNWRGIPIPTFDDVYPPPPRELILERRGAGTVRTAG